MNRINIINVSLKILSTAYGPSNCMDVRLAATCGYVLTGDLNYNGIRCTKCRAIK